jgi:hypothetical protein
METLNNENITDLSSLDYILFFGFIFRFTP